MIPNRFLVHQCNVIFVMFSSGRDLSSGTGGSPLPARGDLLLSHPSNPDTILGQSGTELRWVPTAAFGKPLPDGELAAGGTGISVGLRKKEASPNPLSVETVTPTLSTTIPIRHSHALPQACFMRSSSAGGLGKSR